MGIEIATSADMAEIKEIMRGGVIMALAVEAKVERLVKASEAAGRKVVRVIVEGNKIELVYDKGQDDKDAFDLIDVSGVVDAARAWKALGRGIV